jgi:mannosyl-glycoprotein endo-beta-N-acetylglucosaminidase
VRIAAQLGYSDVASGLEARLRARRHRGSVALKLTTRTGRMLARARDADALALGFDGDRIHRTHLAVLGKRASRRVLLHAHGTKRCRARPKRDRRVEIVMRARQRLSAARPRARGRTAARSRNQAVRLRARTSIVGGAAPPGSTCAPYACFATVADVLAWDPSGVRPFDVASVALAERVQAPGPRMLIGLDNGPWAFWSDFDLNAQGSARTGNVYNFSHWQYVDSLYYYLHQLVSVPPTAWVNAAHRNGVTVLGTVTADCDGCPAEMTKLFTHDGQNGKDGPDAVRQLYRLAAAYGFDGWVIDVENGVTLGDDLLADMQQLAARTLPNGRKVQVVYYEAFVTQLDKDRLSALQAAGSWQSDYDGFYPPDPSPLPAGTFDFLARQGHSELRYDAHWATYVYSPYGDFPADACQSRSSATWLFNGRACNDIEKLFVGLGSARAPRDPPGFFQSLALFAPAWTMFGGRRDNTDPLSARDDFQEVDERLWAGTGGYRLSGAHCMLAQPSQNAVSWLVAPRSVLTRVPFFTRFNTGEGSDFFVEGRATGTGSWNMLGAQDPLPMEVCGEAGTLDAEIDYGDAYDGGSSLRVSGTATPGSQRLYLFEGNAPLPPRPAFTLRYRQAAAAAPAPRVVVWIDGQGPIDLEPASTTGDGKWTSTKAQLPASPGSGTLTRIGVGFEATQDQQVNTLVGELGVIDLDSNEPPAQITPPPPSMGKLTWDDPSPSTTQYYNVWSIVRGESCAALAGRTMLPLYDLGHPLFAIPDEAARFVVQPVSTSGLAAELSPRPC